jgi:hypothetical protein
MIGFVVSPEIAAQVLSGVEQAWIEAGENPPGWTPGAAMIYQAPHAGQRFMPLADSDLQTIFGRYGTLPENPAFSPLIESLGGLEARVEIAAEDIRNPDEAP